jgi:hypothetical protein
MPLDAVLEAIICFNDQTDESWLIADDDHSDA